MDGDELEGSCIGEGSKGRGALLFLRSVDKVNLYFSTYWSRNILATSMVFHSVLWGSMSFHHIPWLVSGHDIFEPFYFDQFHSHFTNNYLLCYRHWFNNFTILTIS